SAPQRRPGRRADSRAAGLVAVRVAEARAAGRARAPDRGHPGGRGPEGGGGVPTRLTADRAPELVVSEVFGPTFQGEGPSVGRRAGFVRLGRCNLDCSWCDTPYTWDWERHDPAVELRAGPGEGIV